MTSRTKPLNIVFIDDEVDMHSICEIEFEEEVKQGLIKIYYFENGQKGLSFLKENANTINVILVLSDINMPVMSGFSLLETVKKDFKHIEVIMVSAYDTEDYRSRAKKLGADDYFTKPVNFELIKQQIFKHHELK